MTNGQYVSIADFLEYNLLDFTSSFYDDVVFLAGNVGYPLCVCKMCLFPIIFSPEYSTVKILYTFSPKSYDRM